MILLSWDLTLQISLGKTQEVSDIDNLDASTIMTKVIIVVIILILTNNLKESATQLSQDYRFHICR